MEQIDSSKWPFNIQTEMGKSAFHRFGPLIPGYFQNPNAKNMEGAIAGNLLVNPAIPNITIDAGLAKQLDLPEAGKMDAYGPDGRTSLTKYRVNMIIPVQDSDGVELKFRTPIDAMAAPGFLDQYEGEDYSLSKEVGHPMIGSVGRLFLQFSIMTFSGPTGSVDLTIFEDILRPTS